MNTNRIKQIFVELAQAMPEPGFQLSDKVGPGPVILTEPLAVRGNLVLYGEIATIFFEALEKITEAIRSDETWNRNAVEEIFVHCLKEVAQAPLNTRSEAIKYQAERLMDELNRHPSIWTMDLSVYGMHLNCAGLRFGRLDFISDRVKSPISVPGLADASCEDEVLFARVCVEAIGKDAALDRARGLVEQHLRILNALCARYLPSATRIFHTAEAFRSVAVSRGHEMSEASSGATFHFKNLGLLLERHDLEEFLKQRGGESISTMLREPNPFAKRVLNAFEIAGTACLERRPHLSFLLFAIALESLILGETNTIELKFQLGVRVAHLLSENVADRRALVKHLSDLYRIRSKIVHSGDTEVADSQVRAIEDMCLGALIAIARSAGFGPMTRAEDLDDWFNERLLR